MSQTARKPLLKGVLHAHLCRGIVLGPHDPPNLKRRHLHRNIGLVANGSIMFPSLLSVASPVTVAPSELLTLIATAQSPLLVTRIVPEVIVNCVDPEASEAYKVQVLFSGIDPYSTKMNLAKTMVI